jgi:putative hydrolase of the HAD superfamily
MPTAASKLPAVERRISAFSSTPIRVITFDLDDTLWDIWPVIERAERRLHRWLEQHYPAIPRRFDCLELRNLCVEISRRRPELAYHRSWLRKSALELAARRTGCDPIDVEAAFAVFYTARNEVRLFDDVAPALERLAKRYQLGALSNGNACVVQTGLARFLDFALNAETVGSAKPEPEMFVEACRLSGARAEQILHVGDEPEHDVRGAAMAGFRTVWLNRTGKDWPGGPGPDATVRTLSELETLVAALERAHDAIPPG